MGFRFLVHVNFILYTCRLEDNHIMLPAYQRLPPALIAAREDEALTHGQVMYGLIKPTKDMSQIESTAAMVNVIPKKR